MKESNKIIVYTDGSSKGNPGPGGYGSVIIFPAGATGPIASVVELGGHNAGTTNNRMEITAPLRSLEFIRSSVANVSDYTVEINLDSQYTLSGITEWIHNWKVNGWKTANKKDVLNQDLWVDLHDIVDTWNGKIVWQKVKGHAGVSLNERVDTIATSCADHGKCELYSGPMTEYKETLNL